MIDLKKNYQIMGIVNTTPDSFSDGGSYTTVDVACQHALHLLEAGADISGGFAGHCRRILDT